MRRAFLSAGSLESLRMIVSLALFGISIQGCSPYLLNNEISLEVAIIRD
jgi:hypothetical protein